MIARFRQSDVPAFFSMPAFAQWCAKPYGAENAPIPKNPLLKPEFLGRFCRDEVIDTSVFLKMRKFWLSDPTTIPYSPRAKQNHQHSVYSISLSACASQTSPARSYKHCKIIGK